MNKFEKIALSTLTASTVLVGGCAQEAPAPAPTVTIYAPAPSPSETPAESTPSISSAPTPPPTPSPETSPPIHVPEASPAPPTQSSDSISLPNAPSYSEMNKLIGSKALDRLWAKYLPNNDESGVLFSKAKTSSQINVIPFRCVGENAVAQLVVIGSNNKVDKRTIAVQLSDMAPNACSPNGEVKSDVADNPSKYYYAMELAIRPKDAIEG